MKKVKYIVLISCLLMLSGCIKNYNTMTIKNDKSMIFESEVLIAEELKENMNETFNRQTYENAGFSISEAKEDGYSGYKFTKKYNNIDKYSNNDGAVFVISDILNGEFNDKILFKVEKGFLKNTYTATFKYAVDSEEYTDNNTVDIETPSEENGEENITTEDDTEEDITGSEEDFGNLIDLVNEMEFNYKLILPTKSISNNATNVSEDGKTLTWNLISDGESNINFSFSLYNLTNILILGGSIILVIVLIIVIIIIIKHKKSQKDTLIHTDYDPSIMNNINTSQNNTQTQNINSSMSNQNMNPIQTNNQNINSSQMNNQNSISQMPINNGPMPANKSLEIILPSEDTQSQVKIVEKQAMFVTKNNEYVEEKQETVKSNETVIDVPNGVELNDNKNLQN